MEQYYDDTYEEEGLTCHTAPGVVFTSMEELKEHYRSDWHRYNLNRKVALLPVVGKELFERVVAQAGAAKTNEKNKQVGKGHLKRPEELPRSVAKAKRIEVWIDNHKEEIEAAQAKEEGRARRIAAGDMDENDDVDDDVSGEEYEEDDTFDEKEGGGGGGGNDDDDDDDSGWESMDEDEAEEVLVRMERMAKDDGEYDDGDDESDLDAEGMELDLTNAPVRLADNGFELIITRDDGTKKRIGPRELRRFYKQRPRPQDNREMVLAVKEANSERGLARAQEQGLSKFDANGRFSPFSGVSILVKRAQKAAQKYERNNMFQGNSSIKKFDLNGQNVKIKLPKACPY